MVRAENIHLTLAFLGEVEEKPAVSIQGHRHSLPIDQARYWAHNQIVWVGSRETPAPLEALSDSLKTETRRFAAHVTLIRKARDPGRLPPLPAVNWSVDEVVLVNSTLSARGSRYEVLQRYPLG